MDPTILDRVPLAIVFAATLAIALGAIVAGFLRGRHDRRKKGDDDEGPVGAVVTATSGLLAFMVAMTFAGAASRIDLRKGQLLDEVNAIGTAYLRAALVAEPQRSEVRGLLREYVALRASEVPAHDRAARAQALLRVVGESERIHRALWSQAEAISRATEPTEYEAMLVDSLGEVVERHNSRAATILHYRVAPAIWYFLLFAMVLAMAAMGYDFGLSKSRHERVAVVLALTTAAVITLVADLDRPGAGTVNVSQAPMRELQRQIEAMPD